MTTIFEKVFARTVPTDIIYEDEQVVAFLANKPVENGHALIVPKETTPSSSSISENLLNHMMMIGAKIGLKQEEQLGASGVNFIIDNEKNTDEEIFTTHLHVVPRFEVKPA